MYFFGTALYVGLLLTNAIAILSEERFLARSKHTCEETLILIPLRLVLTKPALCITILVGWSTLSYSQASQAANAGFGAVPHDPYSAAGAGFGGGPDDSMTAGGAGGASIKQRMISLIAAVRTLMRSKSFACSTLCCEALR